MSDSAKETLAEPKRIKKEAKNKQEKMLRELYPNKKLDEIELMLHINDKKELKQLV